MGTTSAEMLESLKTAYKAMADSPITDYSVAGRSARKHKLSELREEIQFWEARIEQESNADSGGGNVLVRFGEAQ